MIPRRLKSVSQLEKVIRPIVEGQIRGFLKEHPSILESVDWYAPRTDKAVTFTNSLAKRIVRDLVCGTTLLRIRVALLESHAGEQQSLEGGDVTCREGAALGIQSERRASPSKASVVGHRREL